MPSQPEGAGLVAVSYLLPVSAEAAGKMPAQAAGRTLAVCGKERQATGLRWFPAFTPLRHLGPSQIHEPRFLVGQTGGKGLAHISDKQPEHSHHGCSDVRACWFRPQVTAAAEGPRLMWKPPFFCRAQANKDSSHTCIASLPLACHRLGKVPRALQGPCHAALTCKGIYMYIFDIFTG